MSTRCRPPPPLVQPSPPSCPHSAAECAAATCVLCTCCPLALLWCCVQIPFRLSWRVARSACGGSDRCRHARLVGTSSSFSDIDFDADLVELTSADEESVKGRCFGLVGRHRRRDRLSSIRKSSRVSTVFL